MGKKKMAKATLDALVNRASSSERDKMQIREFESDVLEMTLTFRKIPLSKVLEIMDSQQDDSSLSETMDTYKNLIYKSCNLLQSKELQSAYNCAEPYDIVCEVFEDNMEEVQKSAELILSMYGLGETLEKVKNE